MLKQPIGQGAFTVVNMGYNTEIPNVLHMRQKNELQMYAKYL